MTTYIVAVHRQSGAALRAMPAIDTTLDPDEFNQYTVELANDEAEAMTRAEAIHLGVSQAQARGRERSLKGGRWDKGK